MAKLQTMEKEIHEIKLDLKFIKQILTEDFELSDNSKKLLSEARNRSEQEYVDL